MDPQTGSLPSMICGYRGFLKSNCSTANISMNGHPSPSPMSGCPQAASSVKTGACIRSASPQLLA